MSRQERQPNFLQRFITRNTSGWEWAGKDAAAQAEKVEVQPDEVPVEILSVEQLEAFIGQNIRITSPGKDFGYAMILNSVEPSKEPGVIAVAVGENRQIKMRSGSLQRTEEPEPVKINIRKGT